jgi:SnoaL-like domain
VLAFCLSEAGREALKHWNASAGVRMSNNNLSTLIEDEHQIASLVMRWGHARDSDDWETLAGCFHDDATIHISWISGPAKDFIARSRAMAAARKPGDHTKHLISGPWIRVNQDRAFSRCHVNFYIRATIDGHEFDLQSWFRFFDLLERRDNLWRILKCSAVYEKDRLEPVDPRGVPKEFFLDMDLSQFPASAKFLCYWQLRSGRPPSTRIVSVYSDEERALREEGEMWLENA